MGQKITGSFIRDAAIAAIIAILGSVGIKYADLPSRVSVVESQQTDIKQAVQSMDGKLDILIQRTR